MTLEPPLFLASRSPRRLLLLREAGFRPIVVDSGFDDSGLTPGEGIDAENWTSSLALAKAKAARARLNREGIVTGTILAADTVCVIDSRIESQPKDRADARKMLVAMRNGEHPVITAVVILPLSGGLPLALLDRACVRVGPVSDAAIDEYLDSGDWRGKAGAYNLVERQQAGWPIVCEGDPATVMGLPMQRLAGMLANLRSEI